MSSAPRAVLLAALIGASAVPAAWARGDLGDPTRPTGLNAPTAQRAAAQPGWVLQSILVAPDRRVAVINGRSVRVGETVDGARVVGIDADRATLDAQGRRIDLRLHPQATIIRKGVHWPRGNNE